MPIEGLHFVDRSTAEKERNRRPGYIVCVGPDHKRYLNLLAEIARERQAKEKQK